MLAVVVIGGAIGGSSSPWDLIYIYIKMLWNWGGLALFSTLLKRHV